MEQTQEKQAVKADQPPRIILPFRARRVEPGEWAFDHRVGLMVTLIALMVGAIAFLTVKIRVGERIGEGTIIVDIPNQPAPELTPEQIRQMQAQQYDFSDVRNRTSNEAAQSDPSKSTSRGQVEKMDQLNDKLSDAKGTDAGEIYDQAAAVQERTRANRQAYEKGLKATQDIANSRPATAQTTAQSGDTKVKGKVTVSFSFVNPVRRSVNLVVPAYQCEGGGEVVLRVTLNRNGSVSAAAVDGSLSTGDNCMVSTAIKAAKASRFNVDGSAPDKHQGTISYIFIPQ